MNDGDVKKFTPPLVLFDEPADNDSDYLFVMISVFLMTLAPMRNWSEPMNRLGPSVCEVAV
jgi:hypothetical protein